MPLPAMTRRLTTLLPILVVGAMLSTMIGCGGGGKSVIRGRVIAGTVGQAVTAAPADERFDEPGLPDMKVTVLARGGSASRGRGVYANATSDEMGDFELIFPGGSFPRDAVEIRVTGDGIFTARSTTFMPAEGDQVLCVVITRPGYVRPEPNRDDKE
jgi:hypothetical protein